MSSDRNEGGHGVSIPDIVRRPEAAVPVVATSDVVVVGGGPAGVSAAVSAARNGVSVTLVERYPYLGGLASGGMVLVLDDMHNDTEISVRGQAMEIIERMHSKGLCVYPPEAGPATPPSVRRRRCGASGRAGACSISIPIPSRIR